MMQHVEHIGVINMYNVYLKIRHEQRNATKEYRIQTVAIHCEIEYISCALCNK